MILLCCSSEDRGRSCLSADVVNEGFCGGNGGNISNFFFLVILLTLEFALLIRQ